MQFELTAKKRNDQGSGASRRLRRAGRVPAVVYGGNVAAEAIELDMNTILLNLRKEAFHASVLTLDIEGKKEQVLLRDSQMHPYKAIVLHVDFQRVDANTKLTLKVPLHFKGEETSQAVKIDKCLVTRIATEVEITCLPADIPEFIEVDLSGLTKGQSVHASDLSLPKGVKIAAHGKVNPVIVSVSAPASEEAPAAE